MSQAFGAASVGALLKRTDQRINDPRGYVGTGYSELDELLHRGGLAPKTLCILGGRKGTRKTTVTVNLIARLLLQGRAVGFAGLDESQEQYTLKIMSAMYALPLEALEDEWNNDAGFELRERFSSDAKLLTLSKGYRPNAECMAVFLDQSEKLTGHVPEVVFLDYLSLMHRPEYGGHNDVSRVPLLLEDLQVWTNQAGVVTVVLHQVNRANDMSGRRNHGDRPLTPEDLAYGGEAIADIIFSTYRPSLDPLGNADKDEAMFMLPMSWTDDEKYDAWRKAKNRVEEYWDSTFLQLTKNRPGVHTDYKGIRLHSCGDTMKLITTRERTDLL